MNTLVLIRTALSIGIVISCGITRAGPSAAAPRFEVETLSEATPLRANPLWLPQRANAAVPPAAGTPINQGVSARWWWGSGKLALGAGADWSSMPLQPGIDASAQRQRFALEFRARSLARDSSSLLRLQLSSDAALHFRPRSQGLQISYRERF